MTIGNRLKQWRIKNNLTTSEISDKTGISTGGLSEYENDKKLIGSKTLISLYKTYHIDINWILTGERNENNLDEKEEQIIQFFKICDEKTKEQILNFMLFCLSNQNNASASEGKLSDYKIG
jgi:HTH-type transcriptional regulator, cell division transcriptional repressor